MEKLAERITAMAVSATLAMSQKSKDLQAKGVDVIDLSVGEPDFFTPDFVKEAAREAIAQNYSFYSPVPGYRDLREAIAEKLKRENGLDYSPDQVIVSGGAKHSIANVLLSLVDHGDEVIVLAPYWVSYVELVKLAGGVNVIVGASIDNDYKVTASQLNEAITPRTKVVMINSPCNPTGSVYTREELREIAGVIERHPGVFVLSDEIYEYINFSGAHEAVAQFPSIFDRVVTINGVSKGYAMTGWRIGYMAGPLWIAKACNKLQGQMTSGPSSIAQRAALAAVRSGDRFAEGMREIFRKRRDFVVSSLREIPGTGVNLPQGAFYVFPDISCFFGLSDGETNIGSAMDLALFLLDKAHVSVVPGCAFGEPNCIRLSYATSDEKLSTAMEWIRKALESLH